MVVTHNLTDLFNISAETEVLTLPAFKENTFTIKYEDEDNAVNVTKYQSQMPILPFSNSDVFNASILEWRRLTTQDENCKDVYEMTFDITGSNFHFSPGDTIGIVPHNSANEVDMILNHLDIMAMADKSYSLAVDKMQKSAKIPPHVPVRSTLRHVLTHCLDLRSVIKKVFLLALSKYTKDENERKVLEYICSKEGTSNYNSHILNKGLCVLDLFSIFKTCKPPIEVLLANLSRLLPRPYSIANSIRKDKNILNICFSVIDIGNGRKGLTTSWLESIILHPNSSIEQSLSKMSISRVSQTFGCKVPIYLRKNVTGFLLPEPIEAPLILIGPGTGVAPFIGFLEDREFLKKENPNLSMGETWLFFGCRNPKLDFLYEKELTTFLRNGTLSKLHTAFSRVDNSEAKYVQESLLQNGEDVVKLIKKGASIFICGDLKTIAVQIKDILVQNLVKYDCKTKDEAEKFITDLQKDKKYLVDMWS